MEYIPFNYYTISLLIGGFTALISGIVVLIHDYRRLENQVWFALTISTAIWSFGYFFMTISEERHAALVSNWILHYAAIVIPLFYYLLVLTITNTFKKNKNFFIFFSVLAFIFILINPFSFFVAGVEPKVGFNYAPVPGQLYIFFLFYFITVVWTGIITTGKAIRMEKEKAIRLRLIYTIIFTFAAALGGGSVFLTTFINYIPPYLLILFSIYPAISGYAILKHQLFEVKVVIAQIFIFILWIFILIRVLLAETLREQIANLVLLLITILLGIFLVRSVMKEVNQREKIELLAKDLQKANDRLKELDKQKSEFVSFATHQLRAPLTAMKGYASLMLEGDMGEISKKVKDAILRIYDSSNTLTTIVDDYLNISRIELNSMKYTFEVIDLKDLVQHVIAELKPMIEKTGLTFSFNVNEEKGYMVHADKEKFKQILTNLIDNSVKYTPSGSVTVSIQKNNGKIVFSVKDTGIGIAEEVMPKLFARFSRAENANKQNIHGTGLGLFVAKQIVEAHKGRIWAESAGEGRGSAFFVELEEVI